MKTILSDSSIYLPPSEKFQKLEARNTNYRFDLERDIRWKDIDSPGMYFTDEMLAMYGMDMSLLGSIKGLDATIQWAMAVYICEDFVALEEYVLRFFNEEQASGHLPGSRSVELFDEEEIKHVRMFRRLADALKAKRPDVAARFDKYLADSFKTVWWHGDHAGNYPSVAIYHFIIWLHAVFFEEYSLYLYDVLKQGDNIQPVWLSAHYAHMREETQHVITDMAYLDQLDLDEETRKQWGRWFIEKQLGKDGLIFIQPEKVWKFLMECYPDVEYIPALVSLLSNPEVRKQGFLQLIHYKNFFHRTKDASRFSTFAAELFPGGHNKPIIKNIPHRADTRPIIADSNTVQATLPWSIYFVIEQQRNRIKKPTPSSRTARSRKQA
uniref:p-aminobenzoate N-oxygenase AurF n=1 Tax=Candidatus Kentrum sp. LPFa TaxID=2126335 RepID=A0A450XQW7_9GAMM|nr:MAG: hypothetical protein BECKLPF1236A_GA0070988_101445 [Candidatus Kentron sp. LPFa]VFK31682.1 MAG: hypothetical protein BECKLPF1236C_GA0070990_101465 [Candidatus Kentron sp. LPFa]